MSYKRADLQLLQDAIDIHIHSAPSLFKRHESDDIVRAARDAGFRAVVLKNHHICTVDRAATMQRKYHGIDVFGSITLNYANGGVNPFAVDYALRMGAREVWMPTIDSARQEEAYGALGGYGAAQSFAVPPFYERAEGIYILDEQGKLKQQAREVLEVIAAHNAILAVGHLTHEETRVLVSEAAATGVERIVVDHPHLPLADIPMELQQSLAEEGAFINYAFSEITPKWYCIAVPELAEQIRSLGPERIVLSSDLGQLHNPLPSEGIRVFVQLLMEEGIEPDQICTMLCDNPAALLY